MNMPVCTTPYLYPQKKVNKNLSINISKMKKLMVDFCRTKPPLTPVSIQGDDVEVVHFYKYLGVHLDDG